MGTTHGGLTTKLLLSILGLTLTLAAACSSATPAPSPAASAPASARASAPASTSASPSMSAAGKDLSPAEQNFQKGQDDWKLVVAAAQKEQQPATVFSIYPADFNTELQKVFNQVDPKIQVNFVFQGGATAMERARAEQGTAQYVVSGYVGAGSTVRPMAQDGFGVAMDLPVLRDPSIKWVSDPLQDKPLPTVLNGFNKTLFVVNTNLLPPGQEPKTWTDLADPKWKNKLVMQDTHIASVGQVALGYLYLSPPHGPDLVRKILENTRLVSDNNVVARMVVQGEAAVGLIGYGTYQTVKDGPVKLVSPTDGAVANGIMEIMYKNAPQPNTTRVFMNWLMDKEAQKIISRGYGVVRADVDVVAKDAQMIGEKFMANVPPSVEYDVKTSLAPKSIIAKWTDELGK